MLTQAVAADRTGSEVQVTAVPNVRPRCGLLLPFSRPLFIDFLLGCLQNVVGTWSANMYTHTHTRASATIQNTIIWYCHRALESYGQEGNRRSGVALVMRRVVKEVAELCAYAPAAWSRGTAVYGRLETIISSRARLRGLYVMVPADGRTDDCRCWTEMREIGRRSMPRSPPAADQCAGWTVYTSRPRRWRQREREREKESELRTLAWRWPPPPPYAQAPSDVTGQLTSFMTSSPPPVTSERNERT